MALENVKSRLLNLRDRLRFSKIRLLIQNRETVVWIYHVSVISTILIVIVSLIIAYQEFRKLDAVADKIKGFFGDVWDKAQGFAELVEAKIEGLFDSATGTIKTKVSEWAKDVADEVVDGPKKSIDELKDALKKVVDALDKGGQVKENLDPFRIRDSTQPRTDMNSGWGSSSNSLLPHMLLVVIFPMLLVFSLTLDCG